MKTKLLIFFQLLVITSLMKAQDNKTFFNSNYLMDLGKWEAVDEQTGKTVIIDTVTYKGQKAFHLPAWAMMKLKQTKFQNVMIEAEIAGEISKTMTGIGFRAKDFKNFEYAYFRLMANNSFDAIQYLPVFNGTIPWVLYPNYQAKASFNNDWTHVKLVVKGKQLKVFVNNCIIPNLHVDELKGDSSRGNIMINSEFAEAYYANLTITKLKNDASSTGQQIEPKPCTNKWQMSGIVKTANVNISTYRTIIDTTTHWQTISPDNDGMVNLSKYFSDPSGTVILRKSISTEIDKNAVLQFDYHRQLEIVLNDSMIYSGIDENQWMAMTENDHSITLKLKKGINNLTVISTGDYTSYIDWNRPHFGKLQSQNWGFTAKLDTLNAMDPKLWKAVDETNNNKMVLDTISYKNNHAFQILENEIAILQNQDYKNATIEADIYGNGWIGFGFHVKDSCNYDQFYFRQNASNTSDAIQYVPVTNGAVSWELYYNYVAKTIYENWTHIKIEIIDNLAKVFVGDHTTPDMVVNCLRGSQSTGKILLEGVMGNSYVANLTITRLNDNLTSSKSPEIKRTNITNWLISPNFEKSHPTREDFLSMKDTITQWKAITVNDDGLVNLASYFNTPRGTTIAKTIISADEDTMKQLCFDYTKELEIILNDSVIFDQAQNSNIVQDNGQKLSIHLKKGKNELAFIITGDYKYWENVSYKHFNKYQSFNWGFKARIE